MKHSTGKNFTCLALFPVCSIIIVFTLCPVFAQDETCSFEFEGRTRNYEVYLPQDVRPGMPLVVSLHGYNEDFEWYRTYTRLDQCADTMGFIMVCPQAINLTWNIGIVNDPCGIRNFQLVKDVDDVGFISALLDTIYNRYTIDPDSVYCCGFSTGGEMSHVLACKLGQRFAAVASVAGGLYDPAADWYPFKPMPVLHIHGTDEERYAPYEGRGSQWSVNKTIEYWVERNQCSLPADTIDLPDLVPADCCTVQKIIFSDGTDDTEVIHYKVIGGGHSWPGSYTTFSTEGNKNRDISANSEILRFFRRFQNPYADIAWGKSIEIPFTYMKSEGDTLSVKSEICNPENHSIRVYAMIEGMQFSGKDSILLFDDGQHGDKNPGDLIYGGSKYDPEPEEDYYMVYTKTFDDDAGTRHSLHKSARFLRGGPVVPYHSQNCPSAFLEVSYTASRKLQTLRLILENKGTRAWITDVRAVVSSTDERVKTMSKDYCEFGKIAAGAVDTSSDLISFYYNDGYGPEDTRNNPVRFNVVVYSGDLASWADTALFTPIEKETEVLAPRQCALMQNYPNPFNPSTVISYTLKVAGYVELGIYNIIGQKVATLVSKRQPAGSHRVEWDASGFASGVYFCRLSTDQGFTQTRKMVLMR